MIFRLSALSFFLGALAPGLCDAASPDQDLFVFGQYGQWDSARQAVVGVESAWPIHFQGEKWTSFWQAEVGDWLTRKDGHGYASSGEVALGPAGRYYLRDAHDVYFDALANIGFVAPRYYRGDEREGTVFNFGGAFAFGYRFGPTFVNDISLRAEHFSNGGLRDPNPGRNFFQIRYAIAF